MYWILSHGDISYRRFNVTFFAYFSESIFKSRRDSHSVLVSYFDYFFKLQIPGTEFSGIWSPRRTTAIGNLNLLGWFFSRFYSTDDRSSDSDFFGLVTRNNGRSITIFFYQVNYNGIIRFSCKKNNDPRFLYPVRTRSTPHTTHVVPESSVLFLPAFLFYLFHDKIYDLPPRVRFPRDVTRSINDNNYKFAHRVCLT